MNFRNMPAGHGIQAVNYFANQAKRDGTAWVAGSVSYTDANTLRKAQVEYDPRKFQFIGGVNRGGSVIMIRKDSLARLTDPTAKPVIVGTASGQDTWGELIALGRHLLGWNIRFVIGYQSAPTMSLAARRGELDAFGTSTGQLLRQTEKAGGFAYLAQIGTMRDGRVGPRQEFPDAPTGAALFEGKVQGLAREAVDVWVRSNLIDKWFALPEGTPQPMVAAYRTAFDKLFTDAEFVKAGKRQFSEDFTRQSAADVADLIANTSYPRKEVHDFLTDVKVKAGLPAEPLSEEQLAQLRKKLQGAELTVESVLDEVQNEGRAVVFKDKGERRRATVSTSGTKIEIAGKSARRNEVKAGMTCKITYTGDGAQASALVCR
jgi:tripartite-type tricarboxylate transporter receptor subunit TctC